MFVQTVFVGSGCVFRGGFLPLNVADISSMAMPKDIEVVRVRLVGKRRHDEVKHEIKQEAGTEDVPATPRPFTRRRLSSKTQGSSVKCQVSKKEDEEEVMKAKTEHKDLELCDLPSLLASLEA